MILFIIILLLLQILTYLIIRGGTMNKSPEEIENEKLKSNRTDKNI